MSKVPKYSPNSKLKPRNNQSDLLSGSVLSEKIGFAQNDNSVKFIKSKDLGNGFVRFPDKQ